LSLTVLDPFVVSFSLESGFTLFLSLESGITSKEKNLPETGDKEQGMKKITLFGSFLLILGSLVLFIRFRKVD
ncbi:LPXTG cell wall anchor domain-containing protein, partial [Staphylococcus hominis]